ncbi:MAG: ferredoxin [Acidimicrobiia bacterium]|nr:ferredoxin [Acidimicrobiia bacterium]
MITASSPTAVTASRAARATGPGSRRRSRPRVDNVPAVRIHIDRERCEGHGRCYALAPSLVEPDELGNGRELGEGSVPADQEANAQQAEANCPERAVLLEEIR